MKLTLMVAHTGDDERLPQIDLKVDGSPMTSYFLMPVQGGNYAWETRNGDPLAKELEGACYWLLDWHETFNPKEDV
jgi:hypothetical protein